MNSQIIRTRVAQVASELGPAEAARRLQITPTTLARLVGGLPVREGSLLVAAQRLGLLTLNPLALSSLPPAGDLHL